MAATHDGLTDASLLHLDSPLGQSKQRQRTKQVPVTTAVTLAATLCACRCTVF